MLKEAQASPWLEPFVNNLLMTQDLMLTSMQQTPSSVALLQGGEEV